MFSTSTVVILGIIAFGLGAAGALWLAREDRKLMIFGINKTWAKDQSDYLFVLRRELGNFLIRENATAFLESYRSQHVNLKNYEKYSRDVLRTEFKSLCERFKYISDFDIVNCRAHVLYADALSWVPLDRVSEHYWDICRFQKIKSLLDEDWEVFESTSDRDLAHCEEYVQKITEGKLTIRIQKAMREYYQCRQEPMQDWETDDLKVRYIPHFAELRYGITFKDTNECGIYSVFSYDDPNKKDSISYFSANKNFEEIKYLDKSLVQFL